MWNIGLTLPTFIKIIGRACYAGRIDQNITVIQIKKRQNISMSGIYNLHSPAQIEIDSAELVLKSYFRWRITISDTKS
jgi:hypothetical protein